MYQHIIFNLYLIPEVTQSVIGHLVVKSRNKDLNKLALDPKISIALLETSTKGTRDLTL